LLRREKRDDAWLRVLSLVLDGDVGESVRRKAVVE